MRVWHDWGLRLPVNIARLTDLWSVSGGPPPEAGSGAGSKGYGDEELLKVLGAKADGLEMPDIARLFWRGSHVDEEWHAGGSTHARLKRRLRRARGNMRRYREIATRRPV